MNEVGGMRDISTASKRLVIGWGLYVFGWFASVTGRLPELSVESNWFSTAIFTEKLREQKSKIYVKCWFLVVLKS